MCPSFRDVIDPQPRVALIPRGAWLPGWSAVRNAPCLVTQWCFGGRRKSIEPTGWCARVAGRDGSVVDEAFTRFCVTLHLQPSKRVVPGDTVLWFCGVWYREVEGRFRFSGRSLE